MRMCQTSKNGVRYGVQYFESSTWETEAEAERDLCDFWAK